tara:strand:- start:6231 stop:6494 length:264 start_codon:yes stop_codon:yes gene_type:complete
VFLWLGLSSGAVVAVFEKGDEVEAASSGPAVMVTTTVTTSISILVWTRYLRMCRLLWGLARAPATRAEAMRREERIAESFKELGPGG